MLSVKVFFHFLLSRAVGWHAYDKVLLDKISENPICKDVLSGVKPSYDVLNDFGLWANMLTPRQVDRGKRLIGFREAIPVIHAHQNPMDCTNKKFLIPHSSFANGFGSQHHVNGVGLAVAMNSDRILIQNPEGPLPDFPNEAYQTSNKHCTSQNKFNMECYYKSWSNCSRAQIFGVGHRGKDWDLRGIRILPWERVERSLDKVIVLKNFYIGNAQHYMIPRTFKQLLQCVPMKPHMEYYWWRAISTAYIVRPNNATLEALNFLMGNQSSIARIIGPNINLTTPMTKICANASISDHDPAALMVGVYVRTGDKAIEMKLPPIASYALAADQMWDKLSQGKKMSAKKIFLGSEDPEVLRAAVGWTNQSHGWEVYYTDLFPRENLTAAADAKLKEKQKLTHHTSHHDLEYLSMLLNLYLLSRSDAWVCTLASNICRLIDELRVTVGGKADNIFADLSLETCKSPPCFNGDGIYNLDW